MEFRKLSNCSTDTANVKTLRNFLEMHPDIIICPTDKTKNLAIFDLDDYILKLTNVFTPDKFVPLPRNPIKSDLTKFRALAYELEPYLAHADTLLISPTESLKRAYGLPKLHKVGVSVRPIVSSINSVTSGLKYF